MHFTLLLLVAAVIGLHAADESEPEQDPNGFADYLEELIRNEQYLIKVAATHGFEVPPRVTLVIRAQVTLVEHWLQRARQPELCITVRQVREITKSTRVLSDELGMLSRLMQEFRDPSEPMDMTRAEYLEFKTRFRAHIHRVAAEIAGGLDAGGSIDLYREVRRRGQVLNLTEEKRPGTEWNLVPQDDPTLQEYRSLQSELHARMGMDSPDRVDGDAAWERELGILEMYKKLVSHVQARAELVSDVGDELGQESMAAYDRVQAGAGRALRDRIAHWRSPIPNGVMWEHRDGELERKVGERQWLVWEAAERLLEFTYINNRHANLVDQLEEAHPLARPIAQDQVTILARSRERIFRDVQEALGAVTPRDAVRAKTMLEILEIDYREAKSEVYDRHHEGPDEENLLAHVGDPVIARYLTRFRAARALRVAERRRLAELGREMVRARSRLEEISSELDALQKESYRVEFDLEDAQKVMRDIALKAAIQVADPQPAADLNGDF